MSIVGNLLKTFIKIDPRAVHLRKQLVVVVYLEAWTGILTRIHRPGWQQGHSRAERKNDLSHNAQGCFSQCSKLVGILFRMCKQSGEQLKHGLVRANEK